MAFPLIKHIAEAELKLSLISLNNREYKKQNPANLFASMSPMWCPAVSENEAVDRKKVRALTPLLVICSMSGGLP